VQNRQVDDSGGLVGSFSVLYFEYNLFCNEGTADSVLQNVANTLQNLPASISQK
jgi:hypothetical protein